MLHVVFAFLIALRSVLPEHFSWKSRMSDEKRTKKTGEKPQKNGEKTSFQLDFSLILTLPTFFIAFLYINFFKSWSFSYFLKKNCWLLRKKLLISSKNILSKILELIIFEMKVESKIMENSRVIWTTIGVFWGNSLQCQKKRRFSAFVL